MVPYLFLSLESLSLVAERGKNVYFLCRERQLQIDELTKELKRTQEEYDLIKHKLKGFKNKFEVKTSIPPFQLFRGYKYLN